MRSLYFNISEAYTGLGQHEEALRYFRKHAGIADSIMNEAKSRQITEIESKYRAESQRKAILQLEDEKKLLEAQMQTKEAEFKRQGFERKAYLAGLILTVLLSLVLYGNFRQKMKSREALAAKNDQISRQHIDELLRLKEVESMKAMLEGQEKERKRIARDLHDEVGSKLATVKLHFDALREKSPVEAGATDQRDSSDASNTQWTTTNNLLDNAIKEVRKIAKDMQSGFLKQYGLVPALEEMKKAIESSGQLEVRLFLHRMDQRLENTIEINLYRIVQELVSNVMKHAHAQKINIHLTRNEDVINLMVEDNGRGFDPNDAHQRDGIGLRNIRDRVKGLNGTCVFDSGQGNGTTVVVDIPL